MQIHAKDVITIKSDKDFSVETQGKISHKSTDDMSAEGMSVTVKAQQLPHDRGHLGPDHQMWRREDRR